MPRIITLIIEKEIAEKAEKYAQKQHQELSVIIENYLKTLTEIDEYGTEKEITPLVQSLRGSFALHSNNTDYKKDLTHQLTKKYL